MSKPQDLTDTAVVRRADGKIAAEMGDETVILDISNGLYFKLNAVGASIWDLIGAPIPMAALVGQLMAKFDIDAAACRADVTEFVRTMQAKGLVEID